MTKGKITRGKTIDDIFPDGKTTDRILPGGKVEATLQGGKVESRPDKLLPEGKLERKSR